MLLCQTTRNVNGEAFSTVASREHDYECLHEVVPEKEARAQYMRAVIKDGRDHHSRIAEFEVYSR